MYYLQVSKIKRKLHDSGYSIGKEGLAAIDAKFDDYLNRLMSTWNGHHKRITPEVIMLTRLK